MWELTYKEWFIIWFASGVFHLRGRGRGKFVMGRKFDKGPYKWGNVEIIPFVKNARAGQSNRGKLSGVYNAERNHKRRLMDHRRRARLAAGREAKE